MQDNFFNLARFGVMHISSLIMLVATVALAGCSRAPVITVTNRSSNPIGNVVVSGSGFSHRIDRIAAGAESRFTVRPRSNSGVRVEFDTSGQRMDAGEQSYFEATGGYRVAVTVRPDLNVSVSSSLRGY